ncbi:MAG: M6 family metalloprotease domain-containing protein [Muribaculaceae bacterium]|nr:M6 family metalloprotease domain-containing protein [Muribaculaceae bacterium]
MKLKLLFTAMLAMVCAVAQAVPARPTPTTITQSDGSTITVTAIGDEWHHSLITLDGKAVELGEDGNIYYRTREGVATMLAHEAGERKAEEMEFVARHSLTTADLTTERKSVESGRAKAPRKAKSSMPTTGTQRIPVIVVEFSDKKCSNTIDKFRSTYTSGSTSVYQYFYDQSNGNYQPQYDVYGIYPLDSDRATYGANLTSGNRKGSDKGVARMVSDAIAKAGDDINWANYDNNGDGYADVCIVVYAGVGEAQASSTVPNAIWPCRWSLASGQYYGDGNGVVTRNGVKIDDFGVFNEIYGSRDSGTTMDGIGTFCHEFSHCLGLPDFYETTYSNGYWGIGSWSLMNKGCYNNNGYTPVGYGGYEKSFMGWVTLQTPRENTKYTLPVWNQKNASTDIAYKITSPINSNEYYVLENRSKQGWDRYIPDQGLMVTHVSYIASRWTENTVNNEAVQLFTLVPADGIESAETESADLYGNSNHELTDESSPATTLNLNRYGSATGNAGFMGQPLTEIQRNSDKTVTFWYMKDENAPIFGDINLDRLVDVTDIVCLANIILTEDDTYNESYDLNSDGYVDVADLVTLANLVLNQ